MIKEPRAEQDEPEQWLRQNRCKFQLAMKQK
jgi:hypothetical protein